MRMFPRQLAAVSAVLLAVCGFCDEIRIEATRGRRSCGEETIFQVSHFVIKALEFLVKHHRDNIVRTMLAELPEVS